MRSGRPVEYDLPMTKKELVRVSRALSDPTRLRIYAAISACGEMFCGQVAARYGLTAGTISHHLKVLADAHLIESRRKGQFIYSRAVPETIRDYSSSLRRLAGKKKPPE
jgi:ArsR family transcriptional regulator, arsenate/arsenite/antimonite-responsive transcriptional repressor